MIDRRKGADRRRVATLSILDGWAGIGVLARLLLMVAIIATICWLALQCVNLIARISQLLT